jgi:hypothetical protein
MSNPDADAPAQGHHLSRREWLRRTHAGFGFLALGALATREALAAGRPPLSAKEPHFAAKAKRVLFLCMDGGPSHLDSFDHKPELAKRAGQPIGKGKAPNSKLMGPAWDFKQRGQSGLWISELFPNIAQQADRLCLVRSMVTDVPNHPPAYLQMHCGIPTAPRPSMGAWITYGLGSANENLPGFVTLNPNQGNGGHANYGSAFLPAIHQGTRIGNGRQPIAEATLSNLTPKNATREGQRAQLDFVQRLNRAAGERDPGNAAVEALIESHELAFRMQDALPQVLDIEAESAATKKLYGVGNPVTDDFGRQCLMARRMLEAGVRFVEVNHGGWDQHRNLTADHAKHAAAVDLPIAGLLTDLESRGMLQDTLVIFAGEFGRTPYAQITDGRDHNHTGYTTWFAGGGVKPGFSFGATDEFGANSVVDPVHIHDWHATILHLLGLDHTRLTYRHAGRDMRLTEVKGNVVKGIIA